MKRYVAGLLCWKTNKRCVSSFFACWKSYGAGPTQRHMVLTRSTGCRQQASGKFISRKNEKLLDKQQVVCDFVGKPVLQKPVMMTLWRGWPKTSENTSS